MENPQDFFGNDVKAETNRAAKCAFSTLSFAFFVYTAVAYAAERVLALFCSAAGFFDTPFFLENEAALTVLFSVLPMYLVGIPAFCLVLKNRPREAIPTRKISGIELLTLFLISRFLILAGSYVSTLLLSFGEKAFGVTSENALDSLVSDMPLWLTTLVVAILAPVVEEFLFRRAVIDRLLPYGRAYAVVFSALIFGLAHGNFYQFFYAFFLGLLFGYIYARSGNILYTVCLHIATNLLGSVLTLPFTEIAEKVTAALGEGTTADILRVCSSLDYLTLYSFVGVRFGVALMGLVLFILYFGNFRKFFTEKAPLSPRSAAKAAFLNVGFFLFFAASLLTFVLSFIP